MDKAKKVETISFVAGRSGGHIIPALTLAQQQNTQTLFFSTNTTLDYKILKNNPIVTQHIPLALNNIPNSFFKIPLFVLQLAHAFIKSLWHLLRNRPKKIICMGGYVSIPVCLAGWVLRIPITLWELNVIPGKATIFLAPFATTINVCFSKTQKYLPKYNCIVAQYPIKYHPKTKQITTKEARNKLNLNSNKKTILILGGSQGSIALNKVVPKWIKNNLEEKNAVQVIHQTGANDSINWEDWYTKNNIQALVFSFYNDLALHYRAASLVLCRSGSGTLHEIVWFNIPCITVPLETKTTNHQLYNAQAIAERHSTVVCCNIKTIYCKLQEKFNEISISHPINFDPNELQR